MDSTRLLPDNIFTLLAPILQQTRDPRGRKPEITDRQVLEAYFYTLRSGCSWRSLPEKFGPWMAIFRRYRRWVENGLIWKILLCLEKEKILRINIQFNDGGMSNCLSTHKPRPPRHKTAAMARRRRPRRRP